MMRTLAALMFGLFALSLGAQAPASPTVNHDGSITFRFAGAAAKKVTVSMDAGKPLSLTLGDDGVWTGTTAPLPPQIYSYVFTVDGQRTLDPRNPNARKNFVGLANNVLVPAQPPAPWEMAAIPHGQVTTHRYTTRVAKNLPLDQSSYVVYTPPGYDALRKGGYPVFYLLHGWSDVPASWTEVGHAQDMMDSMIASGKAAPMLVVMPLGYGDLDFVTFGRDAWKDDAKMNSNLTLFTRALEDEVMPAVERGYNVSAKRESRAIAGLSMGGLESLAVGLRQPEKFAWVAGLSSAIQMEHFDAMFPNLASSEAIKKANLRLLWVACGTDDALITPNRDFVTWAKAKGLPVTPVETAGGHTWLVWRDNFLKVVPLLFQAGGRGK